MAKFQPDALTISRGEDWADRRRFTEAVLDTDKPVHRLADRFAEHLRRGDRRPARARARSSSSAFNRVIRRITRRIILGDAAAADEELSEMLGELMDKSNPPGGGDPALYERYTAALRVLRRGRPRRAAWSACFPDAPVTERTEPAGQVTHWLFALGDTLAINAFRCLALLAVFDAPSASESPRKQRRPIWRAAPA